MGTRSTTIVAMLHTCSHLVDLPLKVRTMYLPLHKYMFGQV